MTDPAPLRSRLLDAGARFGEREGVETATDFGDPEAELRAGREAVGLADASYLGCLLIRGADRERFLQGQCTQDVAGLAEGGGAAAFVLDPKGKNVGDLVLMKRADDLRALVSPRVQEGLRTWLERFIIASDVVIEDRSAATARLRLVGPATPAALEAAGLPPLPDGEGAFVSGTFDDTPVEVQRDETAGAPGALLHVDAAAAPSLWDRLTTAGADAGLRPVGYDAIDGLRTENGRPWNGRELDESVLPVESGQIERAVSFDKGCYTGQEVVARQHFIGKPRKLLCGLVIEGGEPREGDPVVVAAGERPLGHLTSLHALPWREDRIALAVLRGHEHPPGTRYEVLPEDGRSGASARVSPLPFPAED